MSTELTVSLDASNLRRFRTLLSANKRIAAQSLTFTAQKAKPAWWALNHEHFHMRGLGVDRSIQVRWATPSNLIARIGSVDKYMRRHVIGAGEEKRPEHKNLLVPIKPIDEQGTHTKIRAQIRSMMRTKTKPFWRHGFLLRRLGKGHNAPLTVVAVLRQSVKIKPRLDVEPAVAGVFNAEFPTVYGRLIRDWAGL